LALDTPDIKREIASAGAGGWEIRASKGPQKKNQKTRAKKKSGKKRPTDFPFVFLGDQRNQVPGDGARQGPRARRIEIKKSVIPFLCIFTDLITVPTTVVKLATSPHHT
jgi:hypothetical protein